MAVETLGLRDGEPVDLQIENDALVIRKSQPAYSLEDLVREAETLKAPDPLDDAPMGDEQL